MNENECILSPANREILSNCVEKYGKTHQVAIAIEEMSELIKALIKDYRAHYDYETLFVDNELDNVNNELDITEEMADVYIMLLQLGMIFNNNDTVKAFFELKVSREYQRLKNRFGE